MAHLTISTNKIPFIIFSDLVPEQNDAVVLIGSDGKFEQIHLKPIGFDGATKFYGFQIPPIELIKKLKEIGFSELSIGIVAIGIQGNSFKHKEPLSVSKEYINTYIDYLTAVNSISTFKRYGEIAVFTHAFNEGPMLKVWETHYSKITKQCNLYVIDDSSTDGSVANLSRNTNVLRIPRAEIDHYNMSAYCGFFQRFLLQRYEWVISTDVDELLFFPTRDPILDLAQYKEAPTVIKPSHALAVVHDKSKEPRYDFCETGRLSFQRSRIVPEDEMYKKPLVSNTPITWIPGFHDCHEETVTLENMVLLHARLLDYGRYTAALYNWRDAPQSTSDARYFKRISELQSVDIEEYASGIFENYLTRVDANLPESFKLQI
jgi:hypothetical protein